MTTEGNYHQNAVKYDIYAEGQYRPVHIRYVRKGRSIPRRYKSPLSVSVQVRKGKTNIAQMPKMSLTPSESAGTLKSLTRECTLSGKLRPAVEEGVL
jgi:hypothetical protein